MYSGARSSVAYQFKILGGCSAAAWWPPRRAVARSVRRAWATASRMVVVDRKEEGKKSCEGVSDLLSSLDNAEG